VSAGHTFLARVTPSAPKSRVIEWPLPTAAEAPPKVRVRRLNQVQLEEAHFATHDHFKAVKRKVAVTDPAFVMRERLELVWRAYRDPETDGPISTASDDLADEFTEAQRDALYAEWSFFQSQVTARPLEREEMRDLVEAVKKNSLPGRLLELPSTALIELIAGLGAAFATSTGTNSESSS
jgi:hypothetical protein